MPDPLKDPMSPQCQLHLGILGTGEAIKSQQRVSWGEIGSRGGVGLWGSREAVPGDRRVGSESRVGREDN